MNPIIKYVQETRAELRHVAWPTRAQTVVYTVIVALLSIGVALYLGLFDYIFTSSLTRALSVLPQGNPITVTQQPTPTTQTAPLAPLDQGPLNIVPGAPSTNNPTGTPKK